jgi:hypothetical protein
MGEAAEDAHPAAVREMAERRMRPLGVRYIGVAPLAEDRMSGGSLGSSSSFEQFRGATFDDPVIIQLTSLRPEPSAISSRPTQPGVENGELPIDDRAALKAYVAMIRQVMCTEARVPTLKTGISFGLQSLMDKATPNARQIVDLLTMLGLVSIPTYRRSGEIRVARSRPLGSMGPSRLASIVHR